MDSTKYNTNNTKKRVYSILAGLCLALGLLAFITSLPGLKLYYDSQNPGSLPWKYYLFMPLHAPFKTKITAGDYILFITDKRMLPYYAPGVSFGKRVIGMPGDKLVTKGRDFFLNGRFIAQARKKDSLGNPAPTFVFSGKIPPDHYFVLGHHPHSFDSRYWGFIRKSAIKGRLIPLGGRTY